MTSLRRLLLFTIPLLLFAVSPAADDKPTADEQAIQDAAVKFVDAYNSHDFAAIATLFDPNARLEEADGTVIAGAEAIQKGFQATFEADPDARIGLDMASLTMLTPDIAVEQGATEFYPDGETLTSRGRYQVVHQKKDGKWRMISVRSLEKEVLSNYEYLCQLEWLVGDWVDEGANETVETTFRWDDDRNFLLSDFQVKRGREVLAKGTQRLGWDPQKKQIRGWVFDSQGGFANSRWLETDGSWSITTTGVSSDGANTSETRTLVPGQDRVGVRISNRVIDGEQQADIEFMMVRRPPAPASKALAPSTVAK
ncbi:SnoaL-like domain protein [Caulifigura coniformis]|uniref:SnoaL-like domain protein n=1 Tax=Caulifigura coniformis TaxID=2527983 RepID=A0A517SLW6_9PLAN|nr:SgcJ/EcaC family oxidoreductase [Caulifigura coniformis]QDT57119.1 SnoaL-like domain protein [Caulifigura coniformis]